MDFSRRNFLKFLGIGGASTAAVYAASKINPVRQALYGSSSSLPAQSDEICLPNQANQSMQTGPSILGRIQNAYGGMAHPPAGLDEGSLQCFQSDSSRVADWATLRKDTACGVLDKPLIPGAPRTAKRRITLEAVVQTLNIAQDTLMDAWTFNGQMPGPVIRAREGELLEITFKNKTPNPHSLHFHGSHDPSEDGWQPVIPGGEQIYKIRASPAGIHPYHCHVPPVSTHTGKGLFGSLIVDPARDRPAAKEVILTLSGIEGNVPGKNQLYTWNGIAGFYERFPIKVKAGELIRLYLVNMVEFDPVVTFHIHGVTFDIYKTGTRMTPDDHSDVLTLGMTERAILEFRLPVRGRYMFHPHQAHMAERGAMGWFVAI